MADGRLVRRVNTKQSGTTEYQRFKEEYFTGQDIRIYFGDIWVDEITSLQFTLQEQVAPIFGYASYTWDKVARGNRYIQGSFTINFKESYYLHSVMNSLNSEMKKTADGVAMYNAAKWKDGVNIEHLVGGSANSNEFEKLADQFEKSLWGEGDMMAQVSNRDQTSYFYPDTGDNSIDGLNLTELRDHGFNIIIGYGPLNEANGTSANETAKSLIGVQLTGCSQIIGGDGQPVQEQYTFIAKDMDGNVTVKA